MNKNYRKIVIAILTLAFISFGVMGALAAESSTSTDASAQTTTEQASTEAQTTSEAQPQTQSQTQAQAAEPTPVAKPSRWKRLLDFIVNAIILGIVGILLLIIGYYIWEMVTVNYSVREQLVDHKNTAVAIVTASFVLGMAIVIGIALTKL